MVDHLSAKALVNAVGGFSKEECFQTAQYPFQQGHHHQGNTQHLQGVEAALTDHLVDDHLDQQWIGQAKQLHHKTGDKNLNQHAAIFTKRWEEPGETKGLIGGVVGPVH